MLLGGTSENVIVHAVEVADATDVVVSVATGIPVLVAVDTTDVLVRVAVAAACVRVDVGKIGVFVATIVEAAVGDDCAGVTVAVTAGGGQLLR